MMVRGKSRADCPSIDRIDNTLGYLPGNIHVICLGCNGRKGSRSLAELAGRADALGAWARKRLRRRRLVDAPARHELIRSYDQGGAPCGAASGAPAPSRGALDLTAANNHEQPVRSWDRTFNPLVQDSTPWRPTQSDLRFLPSSSRGHWSPLQFQWQFCPIGAADTTQLRHLAHPGRDWVSCESSPRCTKFRVWTLRSSRRSSQLPLAW